jgi:hypothetical protein
MRAAADRRNRNFSSIFERVGAPERHAFRKLLRIAVALLPMAAACIGAA